MNYSKSEFYDLMQQVEEQDGVHLDEMCVARKYTFTGDKGKPVTLSGCGNSALFEVPDMVMAGEQPFGRGATQVCAVDDDMGRWPRFGGDRFGKEAA